MRPTLALPAALLMTSPAARADSTLYAEVGPALRDLALPTASVAASAREAAIVTAPPATRVDEVELVSRLVVAPRGPLYSALELGFGNPDAVTDRTVPVLVLDGMGAVGVRLQLGPVAAGAELAAGGRALTSSTDFHPHTSWLAETRVRAELVLGHVRLGPIAGSSLLAHERMVGVLIGFR